MDRGRRRAASFLFGTAAAVFLLDRVTKSWAEHVLQGHPIEVIPGALTLRFATNSGGAFSLGQSAPWVFATASIGVAVVIAVTAFRHTRVATAVALGLVLGGALGNVTDRIARGDELFRGRVVDFVDLHYWPVFNLSDAAIVVGAGILALSSILGRRPAGEVGDDPGGDDGP